MGADCCGSTPVFEGLSADYRRRLWAVIAINATMFVVEMGAGAFAGSQALQADALDFLGDTLTYGISLAVIGSAVRVRAWAAFAKAVSLTLMGLWVLGATAYHVLVLGIPRAEVMGVVGFLALAANVASVLLLVKYKDGDANVTLGVAVLAQRRHRQRGRHDRGRGGLGDRDQVAGPDRRGDHGGPVPHVVGEDPQTGARRIAQRSTGRRFIARTSPLSGKGRGGPVYCSRDHDRAGAVRLRGPAAAVGRLASDVLAFLIALPLQPLMIYAVRLPVDGLLRTPSASPAW